MKLRALGGQVPALRSLREDAEVLASPVVKAMLEKIDDTVNFGFPPPAFEGALKQITELLFVAQTSTIDEALLEAQYAADEILGRPENVYWGFQERSSANADAMTDPDILG